MPSPRKNKSKKEKADDTNSAAVENMAGVCCPVVGIGASAGGLVAFKKFFNHMPGDSGIAFVLVPHLDPSHQSLMVELLSRHTKMPVHEVSDGLVIEANHIYIIPPAKYLSIENSILRLSKPPKSSRIETAIDNFLRSLAVDQAERSIGIILSGTSSHGCSGLQAIKANGGLVMVQQPDTAEYDAMPQNAIDTGIVDYILPPEEMPATLIRYVQHAYVSGAWQPMDPAKTEIEELDRVLSLLREHTKHDFRYYRKKMIMRRVLRRMGLHRIDQLKDYCSFLRKNPDEAKLLFRDLLIGVTGFFREPEAYKVLEQRVIPQWIERNDSDTPVRIWIPGCATGEEAYSIAMLLIEKYSTAKKQLNLQIFATDIDEAALEIARQGSYPVSIAADIPPERLSRFFTQTGSHYQVNKQLREFVVFATQNLISDAPFSRLDLISCRNLLIYLEPEVQRKVISLFHFALNEDGHLFLGSSETVGRHVDLFDTVSKKWRVFRRIGPTRRDIVKFPITTGYERRGALPSNVSPPATPEINFAELTRRHLLDDYAPASVLINRKYEVLYFQGPTGDFLEPPTGEPTRDLIAMARQGLQTKLRAACHKAIHDDHTISDTGSRVKRNNRWYPCTITVKPIIEPKQAEGLLLVTFQSREAIYEKAAAPDAATTAIEESTLVHQLEYELKVTRDDLQSTIEDLESSNEELKASNEEIMSMNEELQSANEELETSKEELQSLNEELSTVNSQLQDKVEELDKAHNDMTNLLNSADIATLFLDTELCIRQFTPATGKLLGLISSDAGRPINTFATDFTGESLLLDARAVLEKLTPLENELTASNGHHYLRRTLPYRTADNRIDGLVVTFIDITQRIESERQTRRMATVLYDSSDAITVLALDGSITAWNRGAERLYGYSETEALKMNISDLVPAEERANTDDILSRITAGENIKSFDTERLTKDGRKLVVWITLTPLYDDTGQPTAVAITERDTSERIELDNLRVQTDRLLRMVDHLPAGAVYRENDRLMINRAVEQITGYHRDELATLDQWFHKLYGEQATELRQQYQVERAAGFPRQTGPIPLTHKDGGQRYVEYAAYKFDDHEVWIMHDVSKRRESEMALRDREERLRAVMDNAAEAIIVIDNNGLITDFNNAAEKLFGYTAEDAIEHNVSMLMPSPLREAHDSYIKHYLKTRKPRILNQSRELPGCRKDGSTFPIEITITEVDHLGAFVGIIRDLSAQKTLERQIADISTQEQERIGLEIHDGLGQQLTGLSMVATSIKRSLASRNLPEAEKLDELIKQLQLAIKEARVLSRGLAPVPINPEGLADALTMLARDVQDKTGIDCSFESHHAVEINDRTSAMQIYRIIQEAVNNAVKHAKASKISIYLDSMNGTCELSVSDNGCGFDTKKNMSDGLGMSIMRYRSGIIGCNLEVKSAAGKGTTVRCRHTEFDSTK
jgi:two-component system CheB/CheR fusion protein